MIRLPVDSLVSYHYFKRDEQMQRVARPDIYRLIGDSGAFSAYTQGKTINLGDYAAWVKRWSDHLVWAASLDVIGDPVGTLTNWRTLRDEHGLTTVPTVHAGAPTSALDAYGREGCDFVGLGGMVGLHRDRLLPWVAAMFRHARDHYPQMRFHGWGLESIPTLRRVPFYSVDSSGVINAGYRHGRLVMFDRRTRSMVPIRLDGHTPYRHARLLVDDYGTDPDTIATSNPANRTTLIEMGVMSVQRCADHVAQIHQVTPPASLAGAPVGTVMHVVDSAVGNMRRFIDRMDQRRKETTP